ARALATISGTVRGTCGFVAFEVGPLIAASMISGSTSQLPVERLLRRVGAERSRPDGIRQVAPEAVVQAAELADLTADALRHRAADALGAAIGARGGTAQPVRARELRADHLE